MDDDHYVFVGDYFSVLMRGQNLLESRIQKIKVKLMTPEERKKWEIIEQNRIKF